MAIILDGKKLRDKILEDLKQKVEKFQVKPSLVVILVGEDPASQIYVNNKKKIAQQIGINSQVINYPENTTEETVLNKIKM